MGSENFSKHNIILSFHDCDFYESNKTVKGIAYKFAKIPCLNEEESFIIDSKKIKINYKHEGWCADELRFKRIVYKAIRKNKSKFIDKHGFLKCKKEDEILKKIVQLLSKNKNKYTISLITQIEDNKHNYPTSYFLELCTKYIFLL